MRVSHQESDRSAFSWPQVRLPRIRIAVPSIVDGPRHHPEPKKICNKSHRELLDQFRCDMDGYMPLPVARRRSKKR